MMRLLRLPIIWVGLVLVLLMIILLLASRWATQAKTPVQADLFIQSVVERNGALGWHQLCPALQAQMPLSMLTRQVQEQRIAEKGQGLTFSVDFLGAHTRPQGGQIRVYVITAHQNNGWVGLRTYTISTQASGCVEDVNNS
jgi:hypothetical protein